MLRGDRAWAQRLYLVRNIQCFTDATATRTTAEWVKTYPIYYTFDKRSSPLRLNP